MISMHDVAMETLGRILNEDRPMITVYGRRCNYWTKQVIHAIEMKELDYELIEDFEWSQTESGREGIVSHRGDTEFIPKMPSISYDPCVKRKGIGSVSYIYSGVNACLGFIRGL